MALLIQQYKLPQSRIFGNFVSVPKLTLYDTYDTEGAFDLKLPKAPFSRTG